MSERVDRMFNAVMARAINAEELVAKLRECKGGKLSFTDTPNWLRIKAANCIENLSAEIAVLKKERAYEC